MLRRLAVTAAASLTALAAAPAASAGPLPVPLPLLGGGQTEDRLTVTITDNPGTEGTYTLECHPAGGTHPRAQQACDKLDSVTTWGKDTFAPVPAGQMCTFVYGGPATAHITGTWAGRPVDATYNRSNGCEISRWDKLVPVLPSAR
ncbi:SSI family serine proteinase inhibitor [Streptomyces sp. NPDC006632]|uniref:SSI family serine proteinase inhibitor n=1 Tax=Streptomyces sp. NPDC006632 TaxID=3157182 RepID=UPI0033B43971